MKTEGKKEVNVQFNIEDYNFLKEKSIEATVCLSTYIRTIVLFKINEMRQVEKEKK